MASLHAVVSIDVTTMGGGRRDRNLHTTATPNLTRLGGAAFECILRRHKNGRKKREKWYGHPDEAEKRGVGGHPSAGFGT
jgi:hypothetical protein